MRRFFAAVISGVLLIQMPTTAFARYKCEERVVLTMSQRRGPYMLRSQINKLEKYRSDESYARRFAEAIEKAKPLLKDTGSQLLAADFILVEQFKQVMFNTIGVKTPEFLEFEKLATHVLIRDESPTTHTNLVDPKALTAARAHLLEQIAAWADSVDGGDAQRLQSSSQAEAVVGMLDIVYRSLVARAANDTIVAEERAALVRQLGITVLGGAGVAGALAFSGPVVAVASGTMGTAGFVLAGCAIGATGGAAAAVLQKQYLIYSTAYRNSIENKTSFSCELNNAIPDTWAHDGLMASFGEGILIGGAAGCALSGSALIAPRTTAYTTVGAVALATSIEGALGAKDAYLATRAYLIYQSLQSFEKAESAANAGKTKEAATQLAEARTRAQLAGAHVLNSILAGVVLTGAKSEMQHAFATGRKAIITLVSKSSDNAAVAVQLLSEMALQ
jgi:hypothetical protein